MNTTRYLRLVKMFWRVDPLSEDEYRLLRGAFRRPSQERIP
jgi:hypothetical protein